MCGVRRGDSFWSIGHMEVILKRASGNAKPRELGARRQTTVDDFVVAKASKNLTNQQISI